MAEINGYITNDQQITGYVYNASINGTIAQFLINGIPTTYLNNYVKNTSLGEGLFWNNGLIDISILTNEGAVTKSYVDNSLNIRDIQIQAIINTMATNSSVNNALERYTTNASINSAGFVSSAFVNASINDVYNRIDTSLLLFAPISEMGVDNITYWHNGLLAPISIGEGLSFVEGILSATSTSGGVSQQYVDGSIVSRDLSINILYNRPQPDVTKIYVDASLTSRDSSIQDIYSKINFQGGRLFKIAGFIGRI